MSQSTTVQALISIHQACKPGFCGNMSIATERGGLIYSTPVIRPCRLYAHHGQGFRHIMRAEIVLDSLVCNSKLWLSALSCSSYCSLPYLSSCLPRCWRPLTQFSITVAPPWSLPFQRPCWFCLSCCCCCRRTHSILISRLCLFTLLDWSSFWAACCGKPGRCEFQVCKCAIRLWLISMLTVDFIMCEPWSED